MLDAETLAGLIEPATPAISIYLPLQPEQRDLRAPDARLRALIGDADAMMQRDGLELRRREQLLAPVKKFAADADFSEHRDPGLVIFTSDRGTDIISLPAALPASVTSGEDFHIKPILPFLAANRRFHILALSKTNIRLLAATPFAWQETRLDHLPLEAQALLDSQKEASDGPVDPKRIDAERRAMQVESPQRVTAAVKAALGMDTAPVVLAADAQVAGHFLKHAGLTQIVGRTISLNPFSLPDSELHAKALEAVRPLLSAELEEVLGRAAARLGTAEPDVAIKLEEILAAAHEGRVDALVVAEDETLWGHYAHGKSLTAHGTRAPHDEDLLNCAALLTMRGGGRAFAAPLEKLPRHVPAVALLRY